MNNPTKIILMAGFFALSACAHKQTAAPAAAPSAREQAMTQLQSDRGAYIQSMDAKVSQYQKHAQDLRARAASAAKPTNKKLENAADDLDASIKDVNTALGEVKSAAPENWLDYKRDVEKAVDRADAQYSNSTTLLQ